MVAFMLESMVLRGSVLRDSVAVGVRLGTGAKSHPENPETANRWQHSLSGCGKPDGKPGMNPDVDYSTPGIMPGAGRSRRQSAPQSLSALARIPLARRQPIGTREREGR
jgi:hypothetical protein